MDSEIKGIKQDNSLISSPGELIRYSVSLGDSVHIDWLTLTLKP